MAANALWFLMAKLSGQKPLYFERLRQELKAALRKLRAGY
jgi:hypothetical protein